MAFNMLPFNTPTVAILNAVSTMRWSHAHAGDCNLGVIIHYTSESGTRASYEIYTGAEDLNGVWRTRADQVMPCFVRGHRAEGYSFPRTVSWTSVEQFREWGLMSLMDYESRGCTLEYIALFDGGDRDADPTYVWRRPREAETISPAQ
ncbi:hypothetical protein JKP88DRAFT_277059 [Tribonema minus]|uniref:Uncharacterized protein n=1 Tax=Tribonema minus TaxID=303371 RepID=A0A836CAW2_9STRA|nr:hypothetical protein JKP88DRAFT_291113 [Tribonema minus]KAG5184683.1 hypothetical protein JKP88DRAFT_277059 [Tribonema minus]